MVEAARGTGGKLGWNSRGTGLERPSEAVPPGRCAESTGSDGWYRRSPAMRFLCHIVTGTRCPSTNMSVKL